MKKRRRIGLIVRYFLKRWGGASLKMKLVGLGKSKNDPIVDYVDAVNWLTDENDKLVNVSFHGLNIGPLELLPEKSGKYTHVVLLEMGIKWYKLRIIEKQIISHKQHIEQESAEHD